MVENDYFVLCGGTFFTLLLQAKKQSPKARERIDGKESEFTEPKVLIGLIKVCYPEFAEPNQSEKGSFKAKTSKYKNCTGNEANGFSFLSSIYVKTFKERVETDYQKSLENMRNFTNEFMNTESQDIYIQLVDLLLDLIEADKSIDAEDNFYVLPNGQPLAKSDFHNFSDGLFPVCLSAFLLGIWHFILAKREDNSIGRATIKRWSGDPLKNWFSGDMGTASEMSKRQIKVGFDLPIDPHSSPNKEREQDKPDDNLPAFLNNETASQNLAVSEMLKIFEQAVAHHSITGNMCKVADYMSGEPFYSVDIFNFIGTIQTTILEKFVNYQDEEIFKKITEFKIALESYCAFLGMIRTSISECYGFVWRMSKNYDGIIELIRRDKADIKKALTEEENVIALRPEEDIEPNPVMELKTKINQLNFIESIFVRHKEINSLYSKICNGKTLLVY